ncbi:putative methyltransferase tdiE [Paramyrothecium foliicola]|nr:putative methyltransferase tdiE [Paramyrothecium foliicola]
MSAAHFCFTSLHSVCPEEFGRVPKIGPGDGAKHCALFVGNDTASEHSDFTSITSSILQGTIGEGRRTYAVYGKEEYGFPMDDQELDRMDLCHAKYYALLDKRRYLAPIGDNPQRIVDLGCGTGEFGTTGSQISVAALTLNRHLEQVLGIDIAPTQPEWVPPNCQFELDDFEQPWTGKDDSADFIFARDLILSVRDFPKLIDQAYRHLKPGGWLEFHCVTGVLGCDDGTVSKDSKIQSMSDHLVEACVKFGTPVDDPTRWKGQFEDRGFDNVTQEIFKLPCTPWAKDKRLKLLGMWEQHNLLNNLEGMTMRLFQKGLNWTEDEIIVFSALLRKELKDLSLHSYWPYYVVYGQKPLKPKAAAPE